MNYNNLTIFFVSYYSKNSIEKLIKKINKKIKIIIVENAQEKNFNEKFKNYRNVRIINSKINTGQTGGINIGLKNINTKYSIYMDSDINFNLSLIDNFLKYAEKIKDFVILGPQHEKSKYNKDFISKIKSEYKDTIRMKLIHGHFLFFKMYNVKKVGFYDENYFLYYDETDYCLRAYRNKQKIYIIPKLKVFHKGSGSVNIKNKVEIEIHKHWHFMWSKFYYYRKHYSLPLTLLYFVPIILRIRFKIIFHILRGDKKNIEKYKVRWSGLINSINGKRSYLRVQN